MSVIKRRKLPKCASSKRSLASIKAVILDMDGVITDTMPYHRQVWQELFAAEGITISRNDIYKREGQKGIESVREIFSAYGKACDARLASRLLKAKEKRFKEIFQLRFIPGAQRFLSRVDSRGLRLALVTGTSRQEAVRLLPGPLWDMFEVIICGTDVNNGKPHPEPYSTALCKLGIKAFEAVVIENAPFGIRSAKAAGLCCFALETSLPKSYLREADKVFSSFQQLTSHLHF